MNTTTHIDNDNSTHCHNRLNVNDSIEGESIACSMSRSQLRPGMWCLKDSDLASRVNISTFTVHLIAQMHIQQLCNSYMMN